METFVSHARLISCLTKRPMLKLQVHFVSRVKTLCRTVRLYLTGKGTQGHTLGSVRVVTSTETEGRRFGLHTWIPRGGPTHAPGFNWLSLQVLSHTFALHPVSPVLLTCDPYTLGRQGDFMVHGSPPSNRCMSQEYLQISTHSIRLQWRNAPFVEDGPGNAYRHMPASYRV